MDVFIEQIVRRKSTGKIALLKGGIIVGAIVLIIVFGYLSLILGQFSIFAIAAMFGTGYGAWFLLTSQSIEYEYSLTNGEIDIDKIVAQRKRKRLITVVCKQIEAMGRYKAAEHAHATYKTKIMACEDENDESKAWYVVYNSTNFGKALVVFNPPEKMLAGMKPFLPKLIYYDLQRNGLM